MKDANKFHAKYLQHFDPRQPRETFLDFLESLNQPDWFALLGAAIEEQPIALEIIAPPPGVSSLAYLSQMTEPASPKTSVLVGQAIAEHVQILINADEDSPILNQLFVFLQTQRIQISLSVLKDVIVRDSLTLQTRLRAGMVMAEMSPEQLEPIRWNWSRFPFLIPAGIAAARNTNVEWLDQLFGHRGLPQPPFLDPLRSPLRLALKGYRRAMGDERLMGLYDKMQRSPWVRPLLEQLFEDFKDLRHEHLVFKKIPTPALQGPRDATFPESFSPAQKDLMNRTLQAIKMTTQEPPLEDFGLGIPASLPNLSRYAQRAQVA